MHCYIFNILIVERIQKTVSWDPKNNFCTNNRIEFSKLLHFCHDQELLAVSEKSLLKLLVSEPLYYNTTTNNMHIHTHKHTFKNINGCFVLCFPYSLKSKILNSSLIQIYLRNATRNLGLGILCFGFVLLVLDIQHLHCKEAC